MQFVMHLDDNNRLPILCFVLNYLKIDKLPAQWLSDRVPNLRLICLILTRGSVLEQDTLFSAKYWFNLGNVRI